MHDWEYHRDAIGGTLNNDLASISVGRWREVDERMVPMTDGAAWESCGD